MAVPFKEEISNVNIVINKVSKAEIGFNHIVRIPIHNQIEAEEYMRQGVAIYEKVTKTPKGEYGYYFIEVSVYDLAKIALKN